MQMARSNFIRLQDSSGQVIGVAGSEKTKHPFWQWEVHQQHETTYDKHLVFRYRFPTNLLARSTFKPISKG